MAGTELADAPRSQAQELENLARRYFSNLKPCEVNLLRAAARGEVAYCGPSPRYDDPGNDPTRADKDWGTNREIRADLLRWLIVDAAAASCIDPVGIRIHAARITGGVNLEFANVQSPLYLMRCRVSEPLNLYSAQMVMLAMAGSFVQSIIADNINVKGGVFLHDGFRSEGEVGLSGAQVGGIFDCIDGTFSNGGGDALSANGIDVKGNLYLSGKFHSVGAVRLGGGRVGGNLDCRGGNFSNSGHYAIAAGNINVTGDIYLIDGFSADGAVEFTGAQIGGAFNCEKGTFQALVANRMRVGGTFHWIDVKNPKDATLNLTNASVTTLNDDESSWPAAGGLAIDGLTYRRIESDAMDVHDRLLWLSLMDDFAQQPYRQLARVMTDAGEDDDARRVLFEMERLRHIKDDSTEVSKVRSWILKSSVGYGYYPERALRPLLGLSALGWIIYRRGYLAGAMVPTEKEAYNSFKEGGRPPPHYPRFSALVYSVENCAPLVNLGQTDRWAPDPSPLKKESGATTIAGRILWLRQAWRVALWPVDHLAESPRLLRVFVWIQILLGWILATLFVAGVTGIVRKE